MLCCPPWKDSGQLDELYWITVPAQNLFGLACGIFSCVFFHLFLAGTGERLSFSRGRIGSISTFHRNLLDREGEVKKELKYCM